jgi:hypothetical protein
MPTPDFIYAGTTREYERYVTHVRPDRRAVPALVSVEQLAGVTAPKVLPIGEFYDRGDYDTVAAAVAKLKGEWVVP